MHPVARHILATFFLVGCGCANSHEQKSAVPKPWLFASVPDPGQKLDLSIALFPPRGDDLTQRLIEISNPDSSTYGQYLGLDETAAYFKPDDDSISEALQWLTSHNISGVFDGQLIHMSTNVSHANQLLRANFSWYTAPRQGAILRTVSYTIPSALDGHASFISPTVRFPSVSDGDAAKKAIATYSTDNASAHDSDKATAGCNESLITPECVRNIYSFPVIQNTTAQRKLAFASFLGQKHVPNDITRFLREYAPYAQSSHILTVNVPNPDNHDPSEGFLEANLDAAYSVSLSYPVPVAEYITPGCGPLVPDPNIPQGSCKNEPYLEFLTELLKTPNANLPQVLSISYSDYEQTWPENEARHVCRLFAALGARGVTVLVASGDHGTGRDCSDNSGTNKRFTPTFPSTCPYVTSVGSTKSVDKEVAVDFTGSGFSNIWQVPDYQKPSVAKYSKWLSTNGDPFGQYYNHSGRGFPDISAYGVNIAVPSGNDTLALYGTSASTPIIAAIIALLNEKRTKKGLASMGFLNPWLYSVGYKGLVDITKGQTTGCRIGDEIEGASWNATTGWDPATGLGTPNVKLLLDLV